jgi:hypothetical protein
MQFRGRAGGGAAYHLSRSSDTVGCGQSRAGLAHTCRPILSKDVCRDATPPDDAPMLDRREDKSLRPHLTTSDAEKGDPSRMAFIAR